MSFLLEPPWVYMIGLIVLALVVRLSRVRPDPWDPEPGVRRIYVARLEDDREVLSTPAADLEKTAMLTGKVCLSLEKCPRCDGDHSGVEMEALPFEDNPIPGFTHHTRCPANDDPILLCIATTIETPPARPAASQPLTETRA